MLGRWIRYIIFGFCFFGWWPLLIVLGISIIGSTLLIRWETDDN